ncbi:MAG TPA: hypothetical protein VGD59_06600 [Acidisarcina sp.]
MRVRKFRFDRPQQIAALLLLFLASQSVWVIDHRALTPRDYQYARCGREMWERPSPLAGYFTSCGNLQDGTLAYRAAGLPLTAARIVFGLSRETSTWEMRHVVTFIPLLLSLPFLLAGLGLGGALWWVARRLYGNAGGYVALALYCCCPEVVRACSAPNNEILAAFGLYAAVYTAIGVAHAMHGPLLKWRPRIVLLIACFGFTAAAHVSAVLLAFLLGACFMIYLAVGRRAFLLPVALITAVGTLLLLFASYGFRPDPFSYVFRGGAGRMWFSLEHLRALFSLRGDTGLAGAGITLAVLAALVLFAGSRRSRYFGNTAPLLVSALLLPLVTTGVVSEPWLWAMPFLLTFVGGVFADALETVYRRTFLVATGAILLVQAGLSLASLGAMSN